MVLETRQRGDVIRRRRRCKGCQLSFSTDERLAVDLRVRKSDGSDELFSRAKVRRGITKAAVSPYRREQLNELVDSIEQAAWEQANEGLLPSMVLGEIVLAHLGEFDPVQQVRFALTQLGRCDRGDGRPGWTSAEEVRTWLLRNYPEVEHHKPANKTSEVVKSSGRREPYDRRKLERSVGVASKGRMPSRQLVADLATEVANLVEQEIGDQTLVTTGQIAAEVIRWLRRTDPVAAIRFASTAKSFNSVNDYEAEALSLRNRHRLG